MAIAFITAGTDTNPTGASQFVGITVPVGIQNGDLVLVAITVPQANVAVTPPPDGTWTQLTQTNPTLALSTIVFWKMALAEQRQWVFSLSASCQATGGYAVYRGTDSFQPIDAFAAQPNASVNSCAVPGLTTMLGNEELVLFVGADANTTFTAPAGYVKVAEHGQNAAGSNSTTAVMHRSIQPAGVVAPTTASVADNALNTAAIIALIPSSGTLTFADAYQRVFDALPPGIDRVLDFTVGSGDYYNYFWVVGAILKIYFFDMIDILRSEIIPNLSRYKLPDWEGIFGLRLTRTAQLGTIPQRQAQVAAYWRSAAGQGSSIPVVQSVLASLFGYNPTTTVKVLESDWSALQLEHSYGFTGDIAINAGQSGSAGIAVESDGGKVSKTGVRLELAFQSLPTGNYTVTLQAPDGTTGSWTIASGASLPAVLRSKAFAGARIYGTWILTVSNGSGANNTLFDGSKLFVDGTARGQQTAGAIFDWGVYADPAHLGENGNNADLGSARIAIQRFAFSHTIGNLIQSLAPYPDTNSGANSAIPDECIPTI